METLTREEIDKRKWKSRTFWLTVGWTAFVPLAVIGSVLTGMVLPIGTLITIAGTITLVYMGGEKAIKAIRTKNGTS